METSKTASSRLPRLLVKNHKGPLPTSPPFHSSIPPLEFCLSTSLVTLFFKSVVEEILPLECVTSKTNPPYHTSFCSPAGANLDPASSSFLFLSICRPLLAPVNRFSGVSLTLWPTGNPRRLLLFQAWLVFPFSVSLSGQLSRPFRTHPTPQPNTPPGSLTHV